MFLGSVHSGIIRFYNFENNAFQAGNEHTLQVMTRAVFHVWSMGKLQIVQRLEVGRDV